MSWKEIKKELKKGWKIILATILITLSICAIIGIIVLVN